AGRVILIATNVLLILNARRGFKQFLHNKIYFAAVCLGGDIVDRISVLLVIGLVIIIVGALTEDACFCSLPGFYKRPEQGIFVRLKGMITLVQIQSLMRAVINFYSFNNGNASVVITRVKEHDSENMFMARLEDIRSLSISAKEAMKNGNIEQAEKLMNQVINSMGAFIDAQLILSNLPGNINFVKTKDIIKSYIDSLEENNKVSDYEKGYLIDSIKEIMNNIEKSN
ncbi:MAG: hypothetical protein WBI39_10255, partial [Caldicoprobacterales bacterium]